MKPSFPTATPRHLLMARRPRIVIAGEFSAGKTRLLNALLNTALLPSSVTSSALPPMWVVKGARDPLRLDTKGQWHALSDFSAVDVDTTKFCVLRSQSDLLDHVDLIDTPGTSDPNMPPRSWERMVQYADMVVWCSNANQAWRQSEKSIWLDMPERLMQNSILVLTHADQLPDDQSRAKILRRVQREAGDFFASVTMFSAMDNRGVTALATRLIAAAGEITQPTGADGPDFDPIRILPEQAQSRGDQRQPKSSGMVPRRVMPAAVSSEPEPTIAAATAPQSASIPDGSARAIWNQLSADTDLSDPTEILAGVEQLLDRLDHPYRTAPPPFLAPSLIRKA